MNCICKYEDTLMGSCRAKRRPQLYADSEGTDQPAHPRRLIWAFSVRLQDHGKVQDVSREGVGPDETVCIRKLHPSFLSLS